MTLLIEVSFFLGQSKRPFQCLNSSSAFHFFPRLIFLPGTNSCNHSYSSGNHSYSTGRTVVQFLSFPFPSYIEGEPPFNLYIGRRKKEFMDWDCERRSENYHECRDGATRNNYKVLKWLFQIRQFLRHHDVPTELAFDDFIR